VPALDAAGKTMVPANVGTVPVVEAGISRATLRLLPHTFAQCGWLLKQGRRDVLGEFIPRFFVLVEGSISYYSDPQSLHAPRGTLRGADMKMFAYGRDHTAEGELTVHLSDGTEDWYLRFPKDIAEATAHAWLRKIQYACPNARMNESQLPFADLVGYISSQARMPVLRPTSAARRLSDIYAPIKSTLASLSVGSEEHGNSSANRRSISPSRRTSPAHKSASPRKVESASADDDDEHKADDVPPAAGTSPTAAVHSGLKSVAKWGKSLFPAPTGAHVRTQSDGVHVDAAEESAAAEAPEMDTAEDKRSSRRISLKGVKKAVKQSVELVLTSTMAAESQPEQHEGEGNENHDGDAEDKRSSRRLSIKGVKNAVKSGVERALSPIRARDTSASEPPSELQEGEDGVDGAATEDKRSSRRLSVKGVKNAVKSSVDLVLSMSPLRGTEAGTEPQSQQQEGEEGAAAEGDAEEPAASDGKLRMRRPSMKDVKKMAVSLSRAFEPDTATAPQSEQQERPAASGASEPPAITGEKRKPPRLSVKGVKKMVGSLERALSPTKARETSDSAAEQHEREEGEEDRADEGVAEEPAATEDKLRMRRPSMKDVKKMAVSLSRAFEPEAGTAPQSEQQERPPASGATEPPATTEEKRKPPRLSVKGVKKMVGSLERALSPTKARETSDSAAEQHEREEGEEDRADEGVAEEPAATEDKLRMRRPSMKDVKKMAVSLSRAFEPETAGAPQTQQQEPSPTTPADAATEQPAATGHKRKPPRLSVKGVQKMVGSLERALSPTKARETAEHQQEEGEEEDAAADGDADEPTVNESPRSPRRLSMKGVKNAVKSSVDLVLSMSPLKGAEAAEPSGEQEGEGNEAEVDVEEPAAVEDKRSSRRLSMKGVKNAVKSSVDLVLSISTLRGTDAAAEPQSEEQEGEEGVDAEVDAEDPSVAEDKRSSRRLSMKGVKKAVNSLIAASSAALSEMAIGADADEGEDGAAADGAAEEPAGKSSSHRLSLKGVKKMVGSLLPSTHADAEGDAEPVDAEGKSSARRVSLKGVKKMVASLVPAASASHPKQSAAPTTEEQDSPPVGTRPKPQGAPSSSGAAPTLLFSRTSTPYQPTATQIKARQELDVEEPEEKSNDGSSDWDANVDENDAILREIREEEASLAAELASVASAAASLSVVDVAEADYGMSAAEALEDDAAEGEWSEADVAAAASDDEGCEGGPVPMEMELSGAADAEYPEAVEDYQHAPFEDVPTAAADVEQAVQEAPFEADIAAAAGSDEVEDAGPVPMVLPGPTEAEYPAPVEDCLQQPVEDFPAAAADVQEMTVQEETAELSVQVEVVDSSVAAAVVEESIVPLETVVVEVEQTHLPSSVEGSEPVAPLTPTSADAEVAAVETAEEEATGEEGEEDVGAAVVGAVAGAVAEAKAVAGGKKKPKKKKGGKK
jgi:hypothetical protein